MIDAVSMLRPGVLIALVCVVLAVVLGVVAVRDSRRREEEKNASARRRAATASTSSAVSEPGVASPRDEVEEVWSEALKGIENLQTQLKDDIRTLEEKLATEREQIQTKAEALKNLARQNRIPLTLYELYEGMRHFNRKAPEAQRADMEWHGKIGVTEVDVVDTVQIHPGHEIYFTLDEQPFLLVGLHHRYSRLSFIELSLFDQTDTLLVTARVRPDTRGQQLIADAVISMKSGPWIQTLLACRAKMDTRHREVTLLAEHRDIEQLKEKFALDNDESDDLPEPSLRSS
jgi:hypothetical protein